MGTKQNAAGGTAQRETATPSHQYQEGGIGAQPMYPSSPTRQLTHAGAYVRPGIQDQP